MKRRTGSPAMGIAVLVGFVLGTLASMRGVNVGLAAGDAGARTKTQVPPEASGEANKRAAIEPLNEDVLRRRIGEVFSSGYITLIAIIQGVAFGVLVATVRHDLSTKSLTPHYGMVIGAESLTVLVAIVTVTHQYFLLTEQVRWTPVIFDTLVPYALGLGEVGIAFLLGSKIYWWAAFSFLVLVATALSPTPLSQLLDRYLERCRNRMPAISDPYGFRQRYAVYLCSVAVLLRVSVPPSLSLGGPMSLRQVP